MSIRDYGWNDFFLDSLTDLKRPDLAPGRVLLAVAGSYRLRTEHGERGATLAGRLRHSRDSAAEIPAVGDWVAVRDAGDSDARIEQLLPRRTKLSRKVPGKRSEEQVFAANVDAVFVVMGLDGDFSVRRLERLLVAVWESGARPVVILNKLDLCVDPDLRLSEIERTAPGVPVVFTSCFTGEGIDAVRERILPRETVVLLGSSGVGKSSLINRLLGESVQQTAEVRLGDDRGRHTTTRRELFRLTGGGLLIDSPGLREVQLWSGEGSLFKAFEDVTLLAAGCRFRDCNHEAEPGCSVLESVEQGCLARSRLESYRALQKELRYLELRQNESAQRAEKSRWRAIHREMRRSGKHRRG